MLSIAMGARRHLFRASATAVVPSVGGRAIGLRFDGGGWALFDASRGYHIPGRRPPRQKSGGGAARAVGGSPDGPRLADQEVAARAATSP